MSPATVTNLVYVDKDLPRIARYEIADESEFKGKRFVLTHVVQSDLDKAEPLGELDWKVLEAFRISPPDDFAVEQPEPARTNRTNRTASSIGTEMSDLNMVQIIGRLGKDPDVRRLNNGSSVVSFSVATSETWRDKNSGDRKEKTEWHNIVIFNEGLGKIAESYLKKGSRAYIQGKLQTRKWQDQSGNDKYTTEIVLQAFNGRLQLLDSKPSEQRDERSDQQGYSGGGQREMLDQGQRSNRTPIDDDIPF